MHQAHLAGHAVQVAEEKALTLLEGTHGLEAPAGGKGCPQGLAAQGRFDQPLELGVIRLQPIVEVSNLTMLGVGAELALLLQGGDGQTIGSRLVGVDHRRAP